MPGLTATRRSDPTTLSPVCSLPIHPDSRPTHCSKRHLASAHRSPRRHHRCAAPWCLIIITGPNSHHHRPLLTSLSPPCVGSRCPSDCPHRPCRALTHRSSTPPEPPFRVVVDLSTIISSRELSLPTLECRHPCRP
jgi:hypothetical protein